MKCIVTGGSGFIGSHVVEQLLDGGHHVMVIDDFSTHGQEMTGRTFTLELINRPRFLGYSDGKGLTNIDHLRDLFVGFDVVFHLAAHPRVEPSIQKPLAYHKLNVDTTLNVFEAARFAKVDKVVFSSSSSIYGNPMTIPTPETHAKDPMSPYGLHKWMGEEMAALYCKLYQMNIVCLRYMNVYGPRQPTQGAYVPVIGIWTRQLEDGEPLTITGDGTQTRDFVHVSDVARANIVSAVKPSLFGYQAFNVGSGKNYSLNEIASWMTNKENIKYIEKRFEPHTTKADLTHVKNVLKWEPKHDLKEYVEQLVLGLRDND